MKTTIVVPAYNEERTIKGVIEGARKYGSVLVVISKNSSDNTLEIAKSCGVDIIVDNGKGKGEAMRRAISKIDEGIMVFVDADGSHIYNDIPKLVRPIENDEADMVIGSRFLGGSEELHGDFNKFLRMFFSMCIAQIINWRFHTAVQDTQNGFRAIKAKVAKDLELKADIFDIETEMVMKCYKKGYRVLEIPSRELKRTHGKSGVSISGMGWRYAWRVFVNLF